DHASVRNRGVLWVGVLELLPCGGAGGGGFAGFFVFYNLVCVFFFTLYWGTKSENQVTKRENHAHRDLRGPDGDKNCLEKMFWRFLKSSIDVVYGTDPQRAVGGR